MSETGYDGTKSVMELPPYRGVLVVDTNEFGRNTDMGRQWLADTVDEAAAAFHLPHEGGTQAPVFG